MKLEIAMLAGADSKQFLASLTTQIDRLERAATTLGARTGAAESANDSTASVTPVAAFPARTTKSKPAVKTTKAPVVDEADGDNESFDLDASETHDDGEDEVAPTITKKDLIAACKSNREAAIKQLKKLKINSVDELEPKLYTAFVNAITG